MRGQRISDAQIERIKAVYAETGNVAAAAREAGVSRSTARNYVRASDEFDEVRHEKRQDIIEQIAEARRLYVKHLMTPEVIGAASAKDAATIVGILTDKHQLLSGGVTARMETNLHGALALSTDDPEAAAHARAYAARIGHGERDAGDVRDSRQS